MLRLESGLGCVGNRTDFIGFSLPGEGCAAVGLDCQFQVGQGVASGIDGALEYGLGRSVDGLVEKYRAVGGLERNLSLLARGGEHLQHYLAGGGLVDVHQEVLGGVLHDAQLAVGKEILREGFLLVGHQPGEVGLVFGVDAGHQLDVRAVFVGEVAVPGAAEVAVAPGPLLFAGRHVVGGHMEHTGLSVVLVAALEVVARVDAHIRCGHLDVLVVGDVYSGRVVHLVVCAGSDGEGAYGTLAVVEHGVDVRREDALVVVVDGHSGVGPPEERLRQVGAVVEHSLDFKVCAAGAQREAGHPLLVEHTLHLADPYRDGTVFMLLDGGVDGHERAGAVVLGPVELYTA